jgi:hypothetical protein
MLAPKLGLLEESPVKKMLLLCASVMPLLVGCGGGSTSATTATPPPSAATATPTTASTPSAQPATAAPDPAPTSPAEAIRQRLEAAGYTVEDDEVTDTPKPVAFLVPMGAAQTSIYVYKTTTAAIHSEAELKDVEKQTPDQAKVERRGKVVYIGTIEEPHKLPAAKFAKLVDTAQGQ